MSDLQNIQPLHSKVRELILEARSAVSRTVNFVTLVQNWEIGRMIVEEEQGGEAKAEYGKFVIKELSEKLTKEFGKGYSYQQLMYCRQSYNTYPIRLAVRGELNKDNLHAVRGEFKDADNKHDTAHAAVRYKSTSEILKAVKLRTHPLFKTINAELTWTHYRLLLKVENPKAREFYMNEAVANNWGTRALGRQINSLYYERLLSSQEKTVADSGNESKQLFTSKYKLYLPSEKEQKKQLELERKQIELNINLNKIR